MDWFDIECLRETSESRLAALEKMCALVGRVTKTNREDVFQSPIYGPHKKTIPTLIENLTNLRISRNSLFDFGKPKLAHKTYIWHSDFLRPLGIISFEYKEHGWKSGREHRSEENETILYQESQVVSSVKQIDYTFDVGNWGLKHWKSHYAEIHNAVCIAPANIQAVYKETLIKIGAEVDSWLEEINHRYVELPSV